MKTFFDYPKHVQEMIRKAYEFEIKAIDEDITDTNPYFLSIKALENGKEIWESINVAVELHYN